MKLLKRLRLYVCFLWLHPLAWLVPWSVGAVLTFVFHNDAGLWMVILSAFLAQRRLFSMVRQSIGDSYGRHRANQKAARVRAAAGHRASEGTITTAEGPTTSVTPFTGFLLETDRVHGIRAWSMTGGKLWPLSFRLLPWNSGVNTADCVAHSLLTPDPVPQENCGCGFWAYYHPRSVSTAAPIVGVIEGTGRTLMGSKGFRCEKARIVALLDPRGRSFSGGLKNYRELCANYPDAQIFGSQRAMLRAFPLTKVPEEDA